MSLLALDICSILLNKTYAIDTNQKIYQLADDNTMQCIYTILYGDNLRAGILVHSCKEKTNVIAELQKRFNDTNYQSNDMIQKIFNQCCIYDNYDDMRPHK